MLNEEKVRYMTELAIFEKNEGKKIFPINRYFKKDYVGGQMFRSFFGYTFCYCLLLLMWVLYKLDELLNDMSIDEILRPCLRSRHRTHQTGPAGPKRQRIRLRDPRRHNRRKDQDRTNQIPGRQQPDCRRNHRRRSKNRPGNLTPSHC